MAAERTHNVLTGNHEENNAIDTALNILSVYKEDAWKEVINLMRLEVSFSYIFEKPVTSNK